MIILLIILAVVLYILFASAFGIFAAAMITESVLKAVLLGIIWPAFLAFIICAEFADTAKDCINISNVKTIFRKATIKTGISPVFFISICFLVVKCNNIIAKIFYFF